MPTTNPRISVTLQPSLDAILRRMSELTGQSKSAMVGELLETSMPIFERLCVVLEAAQQAKDSIKQSTIQGLNEAEQQLHTQLGLTMDIFDKGTLPIIEQAEDIRRRAKPAGVDVLRSKRPPRQDRPPLVTRGSGTPPKTKSERATRTTKQGSGVNKTASEPRKRSVRG